MNEELFVLNHKSKYSWESVIYFNLGSEIIKEIAILHIILKKIDIIPTALDGGKEIILANWPDNKHIECNMNNFIPVKNPAFLMF